MLKTKESVKVFILSLILMLSFSNVSFAEEIFISESYSYVLKENEVIRDAEDKAINMALRKVFVTLGARIKSYTTVINKILAEDKIERFSSATAKIQKKVIEPGFDQHNRLVINVSIEAIIDTADIDKWEELERKEQERGFDSNDIVVMDIGKEFNWQDEHMSNDFKKFKDEVEKAFFDGTFYEALNNDMERANTLAKYLLDANYNLGCLFKGDIAYIQGDVSSAVKYWKQAMFNEINLTAVNRMICYYFNKKNYNEAKRLMMIEANQLAWSDNWYTEDNGIRIFNDEYRDMTIDLRNCILLNLEYPPERMFRR